VDDAGRLIRRPLRRAVTGRALVLAGVTVLLVVLLAAPLHRYLSAHNAEGQAARQEQVSKQQLAQLTQQAAQLGDPNYIKSQARLRLQYAMPGDTVYGVITPGTTQKRANASPPPSGPTKVPGGTWNQRLWGTVQTADDSQ
jgi:cell division protein FtsB